MDLAHFRKVSLILRSPDFAAARDMADAINNDFRHTVATSIDNRTVTIDVASADAGSVPLLISRVQALSIKFHGRRPRW